MFKLKSGNIGLTAKNIIHHCFDHLKTMYVVKRLYPQGKSFNIIASFTAEKPLVQTSVKALSRLFGQVI